MKKETLQVVTVAAAFVVLAGSAVAFFGVLTPQQSSHLPHLGKLPEFALTAQDNQEFASAELEGKVWVADLIFTACSGPCLRMTSQMSRIQQALADEPDFKMISITVDPSRDSPERLTWYAGQAQADPARWTFLTGDMDKIEHLAESGLRLSVASEATEDEGMAILHSDRFVLLDREGEIRGYYDGLDPVAVDRLIGDIRQLLAAS
jgi:protein SCO1/2